MEYRKLGPTNLQTSIISYGNWVNSSTKQSEQLTYQCVKEAWNLGINMFDSAVGYGQSGLKQLGSALRRLQVERNKYIVSILLYDGPREQFPFYRNLSRKYLIQTAKQSLKQLQLEKVDIIFCHRPDPTTPIQQTCRAMDWIIRNNIANFWGTSQWTAQYIHQAQKICQKYNFCKPVLQQPQYNLLTRQKIEKDFIPFFKQNQLGVTVWSPLAMGVLTGKYSNQKIPEESRLGKNPQLKKYFDKYIGPDNDNMIWRVLREISQLAIEMQCSMGQLSMGWVLKNEYVCTAITGASNTQQLREIVKAISVKNRITPQIQARMEEILKNKPK